MDNKHSNAMSCLKTFTAYFALSVHLGRSGGAGIHLGAGSRDGNALKDDKLNASKESERRYSNSEKASRKISLRRKLPDFREAA